MRKGAQPTETAKKLLEVSGAWTQFRVAKGDIHTIEVSAPAAEEPTAAAVEAEADEEIVEETVPETEAVVEEAPAEDTADDSAAEAASDDAEES